MKVFVTGGTGCVGREILRELRGAGHSIRFLARGVSSEKVRRLAQTCGAEICCGDVFDAAALQEGMKGVDAVIHLVGIISENGRSTFERVHTRGTANVIEAAKAAGVKRFIHMSALGTRPDAVARYHRTKWEAEQLVRGSGLDFTIFRPSIIYGREDHFVNLFATISRWSPMVPILGNGKGTTQPIPVEDVAKCFVAALAKPASIGKTYDLCGNETLTLEQIVEAVLRATHRRRLKIHVPGFIARSQATFLEFFYPRVLGKAAPLNHDQLIMLDEQNVGDSGPARRLFGINHSDFFAQISAYLA
jgi:NADH dehydrogenase